MPDVDNEIESALAAVDEGRGVMLRLEDGIVCDWLGSVTSYLGGDGWQIVTDGVRISHDGSPIALMTPDEFGHIVESYYRDDGIRRLGGLLGQQVDASWVKRAFALQPDLTVLLFWWVMPVNAPAAEGVN